jgi:hypothetical protein
VICSNHHHARHDELLKIVFDSGRATFALADGEVLGEVDLRVLRRGDILAPALTIHHISNDRSHFPA